MYYQAIDRYSQTIDTLVEAVQLEHPIEVAELKRRFPKLRGVYVDFSSQIPATKPFNYYKYLDILFKSFRLEDITLWHTPVDTLPLSLWRNPLKKLIIHFWGNPDMKIILPPHFENKLETLHIMGNHHGLVEVPPDLFRSETLKIIGVQHIGEGFSGIKGAPNLEMLIIKDVLHTNLDLDAFALRNLKYLSIQRCEKLQLLPDFSHWKSLQTLELSLLPALKSFQNHWDALEELQVLRINLQSNFTCNGLYFNELPQLTELSIHMLSVETGMPFLGKMPLLRTVHLSKTNLKRLFNPFFESIYLVNCTIKECAALKQLPTSLLNHPHLQHLTILECPQLSLPKEILLKRNLITFEYDFLHYSKTNIANTTLKSKIMTILKDASDEMRLTLGQLLMEGVEKITDWQVFKSGFLQLLHLKNAVVKFLVYDNWHLLNPQQQKLAIPNDYQGKSIAILGSMHKPKTSYKQKLISLGFDYHTVVREDTECLIVGNAPNVPEGFWNHPHLFFVEQDLELFLQVESPDFLQQIEQPEWENMRALLWSGDTANEQIVVEMIKSGGIPPNILPDLVLVAKTSEDEAVKSTLRKLLKAQLPQNVHKILSNTMSWVGQSHFKLFRAIAPDFDIAQMIVCHYMRLRKAMHLQEYFQMPQSLNNSCRKLMVEMAYEASKRKSNYLNTSKFRLTNEEINNLLENPTYSEELKNLQIVCGDTIPIAVFNHATLVELKIIFSGETLPVEIAQLTRLRLLQITSGNLKTLPINLLEITTLQKLVIDSGERVLKLPLGLKAFETRLKQYTIRPTPKYVNI